MDRMSWAVLGITPGPLYSDINSECAILYVYLLIYFYLLLSPSFIILLLSIVTFSTVRQIKIFFNLIWESFSNVFRLSLAATFKDQRVITQMEIKKCV